MSKTKQNKKFKLNPIAVAVLVLCALVAVYCGTTAWITSGAPVNPLRLVQLQDFDYVIEYSTDSATSWQTDDDGVIELSYTDISSLESFRVRVTQKGSGVAFARIKLTHEWKIMQDDGSTIETRLQSEQNLPFTVNKTAFYDNRDVDGYIYHKGDFDEDEPYIAVTGFDSSAFDSSALSSYSNLKLTVNVRVDAVQFNRYSQIWGIDELPWRS